MTAVALEILETVSGGQSAQLDREGKLKRANGAVIHRPCPLTERKPPSIPVGCHFTEDERDAVRSASKPLAALETEQETLYESARNLRGGRKHAELKEAEARIEQIKEQHPVTRGAVRKRVLAGLDAAAQRAAQDYHVAAAELAHSAATLEGLAGLRDELLQSNTFDSLSVWATANAVLAPPIQYRAQVRGGTSFDAWGRECYWTPTSVVHRETVRRVQIAARNELSSAMAGASWPF